MTIASALRNGGIYSAPLRAGSSNGNGTMPTVDTYGPSNPGSLEGLYSRMSFSQSNQESMGVGAMLTGIMAGAAPGSSSGPLGTIGSSIAGQALMATARDSH